MVEATLVNFVTTQRYIPKGSKLHTSRHENLKSHLLKANSSPLYTVCRVCQSISYLRKRATLILGGMVAGKPSAQVWRRTAGHGVVVGVSTYSQPTRQHHLPTVHLHLKAHLLDPNVKYFFITFILFGSIMIYFKRDE
jgi:hypothetical protein